MGTIIVIGVFALLFLGVYLAQRKWDKVKEGIDQDVKKDTDAPPIATLSEEGKKTIHQFTRNHGAPGNGKDHSGISPVGIAPGGTSVPDARQCQEDYEKSKGERIKAESGEALRRKVEKYGAYAIYDTPALEEIARRKEEEDQDNVEVEPQD